MIPACEFNGVAVGARLPEMLRETGLVDEIPCEKRHVVKARDDGRNQSLLSANGRGIEEGVGASENVGQEGEEIELHRQAVLAGGHEIRFKRAQRALIGLTVFVAEFIPSGPPAGAD